MSPPRFRVRVLLEANSRIYFIFINRDDFKTIKDVEKHIEKILKLREIELYIDDVLLPSDETSSLIYPGDIIFVKKIIQPEPEFRDEYVGLLDELQDRKQELTLEHEEMDVNETTLNGNDETDFKRKRQRKRSKKKSKEESKKQHIETVDDSVSIERRNTPSRMHIKFDDDGNCDETPVPSSSQRVQNETPQPTTSTEEPQLKEEWQTKLLNLAKGKERSIKTFSLVVNDTSSRNETNSDNLTRINQLTPSDYPVMTRFPLKGDRILFKKLKLDALYSPVHSNYILGQVVTSHSPFVTFKILDGLEELKDPEGKFAMSETECENVLLLKSLSENITLVWAQDAVEPRLVTN